MAHSISSIIPMEEVDFGIIGLEHPGNNVDGAELLSGFLSKELEKTGGHGFLEVDGNSVGMVWTSPDDPKDIVQTMYYAHLIQAGLLRDPMPIIAKTIYAGNGYGLLKNVLDIAIYNLNPQMAERDCEIIAACAPQMANAWYCLGLIRMGLGKYGEALEAFDVGLSFNPPERLCFKYGAIALMGMPVKASKVKFSGARKAKPHQNIADAVGYIESYLGLTMKAGLALSAHDRVSYGMALLALGEPEAAATQFSIVGAGTMKMTVRMWVDWGYRIGAHQIVKAIVSPEEFESVGKSIGC